MSQLPTLGVIAEIIKENGQAGGTDISSLLREALHASENTVKAILSILSTTVSYDEFSQPSGKDRVYHLCRSNRSTM